MPGMYIDGKWLLSEYLFARWGCVVRGTAMIRREAWERVGGMREQFDILADIDMWMRFAMRWPIGYVPEPLITVRHHRPVYYPRIYQGHTWSWRRQRLLYELHASNRLAYLNLHTIRGRIRWWGFRLKLSIETTKWLVYAVVRAKQGMITSSHDSATPYDFWPLNVLRRLLTTLYARRGVTP
jgi:GT2 family glycosyltransferase